MKYIYTIDICLFVMNYVTNNLFVRKVVTLELIIENLTKGNHHPLWFTFGEGTKRRGTDTPMHLLETCPLDWKCGVLITGASGKSLKFGSSYVYWWNSFKWIFLVSFELTGNWLSDAIIELPSLINCQGFNFEFGFNSSILIYIVIQCNSTTN